jgi:hypothetical protein
MIVDLSLDLTTEVGVEWLVMVALAKPLVFVIAVIPHAFFKQSFSAELQRRFFFNGR